MNWEMDCQTVRLFVKMYATACKVDHRINMILLYRHTDIINWLYVHTFTCKLAPYSWSAFIHSKLPSSQAYINGVHPV